jgi:hypothetical protein
MHLNVTGLEQTLGVYASYIPRGLSPVTFGIAYESPVSNLAGLIGGHYKQRTKYMSTTAAVQHSSFIRMEIFRFTPRPRFPSDELLVRRGRHRRNRTVKVVLGFTLAPSSLAPLGYMQHWDEACGLHGCW